MSEKPTTDQIEELRAAAAARMEATSLRQAAREIGMSPSGLKKFIDGTDPYEPTLHRLRSWYGDDVAQREQDDAVARFLGYTVVLAAQHLLIKDLRSELGQTLRPSLRMI